jgi:hypothetical protein
MSTPRQWTLWAHKVWIKHEGRFVFHHARPGKWWVELHGLDSPIVRVRAVETPEGEYYGWIGAKSPDEPPCMIWPHRGLFSMCFPYGPDAEVKAGRGEIVRMEITEIQGEDHGL